MLIQRQFFSNLFKLELAQMSPMLIHLMDFRDHCTIVLRKVFLIRGINLYPFDHVPYYTEKENDKHIWFLAFTLSCRDLSLMEK